MLPARARLALSITLALSPAAAFAQAAAAPVSAKIWLDQRTQIEEYLKVAEVVSMEELKVGVTKPKRAMLAPGGPVEAIAFKNVPPGRHTDSGRATSRRLPPTRWTSCSASTWCRPPSRRR